MVLSLFRGFEIFLGGGEIFSGRLISIFMSVIFI